MKIKRVFELFDSEDLKDVNEIDYLNGNFQDLINKITISAKPNLEKIGALISKISLYHFPFLKAFIDNLKSKIIFNDFEIMIGYDELNKYYVFITQSNEYLVAFGIKINSLNDYDIYIFEYEGEEEGEGYQYNNVDYDGIINIIEEFYIPVLLGNEFGELLEYDKKIYINN